MAFTIGGVVSLEVGPKGQRPSHILVLPANPDQQVSRDMRVTVVQTQDGIYTDDFGLGIQTLILSGTTAWNSPQGKYNGQHVDGNAALKHLYYDIIEYYFEQESVHPMTLRIYDDAAGQAWEVKPIGQPTLKRSSVNPTTAFYTLELVVLRDLLSANAPVKTPDPVVHTFSTPQKIQTHAKTKTHHASQTLTRIKQTPDRVYVVQSGDSLWTIAQKFIPAASTPTQVQTFVGEMVRLNHLSNPNLIFPGEKLRIPDG